MNIFGFLSRGWSAENVALYNLAKQILKSLDTPEERQAAAYRITSALRDGKMTTIEWTQIGSSMGLFGSGKPKKKPSKKQTAEKAA